MLVKPWMGGSRFLQKEKGRGGSDCMLPKVQGRRKTTTEQGKKAQNETENQKQRGDHPQCQGECKSLEETLAGHVVLVEGDLRGSFFAWLLSSVQRQRTWLNVVMSADGWSLYVYPLGRHQL